MSQEYPHSERSTVRRLPERGSHDEEVIRSILDEGLVCHVGFSVEGRSFVIPMSYAPDKGGLILHGAPASRLLKTLGARIPACVTVTLLDGLVLAGTLFDSSMNYRSVVLFGHAERITDPAEKKQALVTLSEHLVPGRTADAPEPTDREVAGTEVLRFQIEEASAKTRSGPPSDPDPISGRGPLWRGVIPLQIIPGEPVPAPDQDPTEVPPGYAAGYRRP